MKQASRTVHAGRELVARSPLAPDLSPAAVHVYTDLEDYDAVARGERPGHYYGRNSNSNRAMLERAVADLEGGEEGVATASGMAALYVAMLALAPKPVTIVATRELYGGTMALIRQDLEPAGYEANFIDMTVRVVRGRIVVLVAEDNLVRGASGVAVQNFNRMVGHDEKAALFV